MTSETDKELVMEMFRARDKALEVAVTSMSRRLDGMNEFRETLREQASHFVQRSEMDTIKGANEARFHGLEKLIYMAMGGIVVIEALLQYFAYVAKGG